MKSTNQFFHWIPRVICIIDILFISVFAMDAFGQGKPMSDQLLDFSMHMIPSFLLIILLIIAWRKALLGGIVFMILGFLLSPYVFFNNYHMNHSYQKSFAIISLITFPFIVVGILFIMSAVMSERKRINL